VLTCITQARQQGLWVLEVTNRHVTSRTPNSRAEAADCVRHWGSPIIPRSPGALEDPLENVLGCVTDRQPFKSALTIWESALNRQLVTRESLELLPFRGRARRLLAECSPFSDSGLETLVLSRLRWLKVRVVSQAHVLEHRVDFLIGERVVLQIDGRDHVGAQRTRDNRHDALLTLNGYDVIRVGYDQVVNDWPAVQFMVMTAIAQGLHLRRTS
jgi:very-short-patch-repair endonuclease